jgi:hypothetical protein
VPHFAKTRPGGWAANAQPTAAEIIDICRKLGAAVSGVRGGCHAPTAPILLGGSGFVANGLVQIYGAAGKLSSTGASFGGFVHEDGDWDELSATLPLATATTPAGHPWRRISRPTSCALAIAFPWYAFLPRLDLAAVQSAATQLFLEGQGAGGGGIATTGGNVLQGGVAPVSFVLPLRVQDHATIVSATLSFIIPTARTSLPVGTPKMRICKVDAGGTRTPLTSIAAGADANGYVSFPIPKTPDLYFAKGAVQTLTVTCDVTAAAAIDLSTSYYVAEVVEEQGQATYPSQLVVKQTCYGALGSNLPGPSNGGFGTNNRVLLFGQTTPSQNGIWISNAGGAWTRPTDFATGAKVPQGMLVPISAALGASGTLYTSPHAILAYSGVDQAVVDTDALSFELPANDVSVANDGFLPLGNIYLRVDTAMTQTELRFH